MIKPKKHLEEIERLKELRSYSILDTLPEKDFDNLTAIAAEICGTPISLVSLLDNQRQWFKSRHGLDKDQTPIEYAFCAHAINEPDDIFIVEDARMDERFHDNPLVTGDPFVIFYAGVPLISENGLPVGTLCVIDQKPRLLTRSQTKSLKALANQVINLLELRKNKLSLEKALLQLKEKNDGLEKFAFIAAHDLKSPLHNISSLVKLFRDDFATQAGEEGKRLLSMIENSADTLQCLVDGLLQYFRADNMLNEEKSMINLEQLIKEIDNLFSHNTKLHIQLKSDLEEISVNKTTLELILMNLIDNAIKYNDKEHVEVIIGVTACDTNYGFYVQDNGMGIAKSHYKKIFKIFETLDKQDRFDQHGSGIGLATVKKTIIALGGSIKIESEIGKGSTFTFTLQK